MIRRPDEKRREGTAASRSTGNRSQSATQPTAAKKRAVVKRDSERQPTSKRRWRTKRRPVHKISPYRGVRAIRSPGHTSRFSAWHYWRRMPV
jgi:hypothetical protein